jgi:lactate dehydrogenase-like 2-hydroxyacid dehydrogenase
LLKSCSKRINCCCAVLPAATQVGIIGAGRIGAAYARMMVEGHKMNLVYYDPYPNTRLEEYIKK